MLMQEDEDLPRGWVPPPLRGWYAIALVVFLLLLAMALEIALHYTKKNNGVSFNAPTQTCVDLCLTGWKTHGNTTNGVMHYVYVSIVTRKDALLDLS